MCVVCSSRYSAAYLSGVDQSGVEWTFGIATMSDAVVAVQEYAGCLGAG